MMFGYEDSTPRQRYDIILDNLDAMYDSLKEECHTLQISLDRAEDRVDELLSEVQSLSTLAIRWIKITEQEPTGPGPFLYFPVRCEGCLSINTSNGDYLRGPHLSNREEAYWADIPWPPGFEAFERSRVQWEGQDEIL